MFVRFPRLLFHAVKRIRYFRNVGFGRSAWLLYDYLNHYIKWKDIDSFSQLYRNGDVVKNSTIWMLWSQGYENAPDIVKKCISSVRSFAESENKQFILLTKENLSDYVVMPNHLEKHYLSGKMTEAHHSDLVRAYLLAVYGGVWCDATCYQTEAFPDYIEKSSFFMFSSSLLTSTVSPIVCSNWFIKSDAANPLLIGTFNMLSEYWKKYDYVHDYYIFHIILSLLVRTDKTCKDVWNTMPYVCNMNPHVFLFSFNKVYSEESYRHILGSCFIHKLTYKFDKNMLGGDNMISYFMR